MAQVPGLYVYITLVATKQFTLGPAYNLPLPALGPYAAQLLQRYPEFFESLCHGGALSPLPVKRLIYLALRGKYWSNEAVQRYSSVKTLLSDRSLSPETADLMRPRPSHLGRMWVQSSSSMISSQLVRGFRYGPEVTHVVRPGSLAPSALRTWFAAAAVIGPAGVQMMSSNSPSSEYTGSVDAMNRLTLLLRPSGQHGTHSLLAGSPSLTGLGA